MKKFEYKIYQNAVLNEINFVWEYKLEPIADVLHRFGQEGWILAAIYPAGKFAEVATFYFYREIQELPA